MFELYKKFFKKINIIFLDKTRKEKQFKKKNDNHT